MRLQLGEPPDPAWRDTLAAALARSGARRLWSAHSGDTSLWLYAIGWRLVRVEWDIWTGLELRGSPRVIAPLASALGFADVASDAARARRTGDET